MVTASWAVSWEGDNGAIGSTCCIFGVIGPSAASEGDLFCILEHGKEINEGGSEGEGISGCTSL